MEFLDHIRLALSAGGLQEVLRLTMEHFHADSGTIHLLEADGVLHLKAASTGIPEPVLKSGRARPDRQRDGWSRSGAQRAAEPV